MSNADKQSTNRPSRRFLGFLRDALFEADEGTSSSAASASSADPTPSDGPTANGDDASAAARVALARSLDEQAGPAVREFSVQLEGLREVITDAGARRRAALRVLSLKGISVQALVLDLERLLSTLDAQHDAFAAKLETRRAAIEQQRNDAAAELERETARAEQSIQRLQTELDAERAKLAQASARRDGVASSCDESRTDLDAKSRGFERAFSELRAEYGALKVALVNPESS
jgi:chromosome segregation ATPase